MVSLRSLLLFLMLGVFIHAPWRLAALAAETLVIAPGLTRTSDQDDQYWQALDLQRRLENMGWTVTYVPGISREGQKVYGVTDPSAHTITMDAGLRWNARLAILAHEGGHTLQSGWLTRNQGETFAEAVATLISHDGLREHARYLTGFRADAVLTILVEWRAIYRAAAVLEDR